ncbi:MAG: c-type cytochrome, partial [Bryobacteraceae bacterium]
EGVDSERGARLFETLDCIECHSVNGRGGKVAADLGRRIDRNFSPAGLAATMWNHAPTMWPAMRERGIPLAGDLDTQGAADLLAYFYSARFFDRAGDAGRGKRVFESRHCADCHGLTAPRLSEAKPVAQWDTLGHPIELAEAMWNHAATMRVQFAARGWAWPQMSGQDLGDLLVYLRNLPAARNGTVHFYTNSGAQGEQLFKSKGCAACHTGRLALGPRLKNETLTDIAAAMWNHAPKMAVAPVPLAPGEMREIVSFLWARQFFEDSGDAKRGNRVFAAKGCARCHNGGTGGAPVLPGSGRRFSSAAMVAALWRHGQHMQEQMVKEGIRWPRFSAREMSDLIAYLNSPAAGKGGVK